MVEATMDRSWFVRKGVEADDALAKAEQDKIASAAREVEKARIAEESRQNAIKSKAQTAADAARLSAEAEEAKRKAAMNDIAKKYGAPRK